MELLLICSCLCSTLQLLKDQSFLHCHLIAQHRPAAMPSRWRQNGAWNYKPSLARCRIAITPCTCSTPACPAGAGAACRTARTARHKINRTEPRLTDGTQPQRCARIEQRAAGDHAASHAPKKSPQSKKPCALPRVDRATGDKTCPKPSTRPIAPSTARPSPEANLTSPTIDIYLIH